MSEPKKVSREEYDQIRNHLEQRYDYEHMSDEKKEQFDSELEKQLRIDTSQDNTDATDNNDSDGHDVPERNVDDELPKTDNDELDDEYDADDSRDGEEAER
ncbi:MAG: hypothetical protein IJJ69_11675 [Oscillospiraceae bacterium]|nr:hypothetical protein [Oscillospiraceae bacterium]